MPTYQYACTNPECGERFDRVQAFTDPSVTECPVCGQSVRKVFSAVGVVFKGSGFYRNDSRSSTSPDGVGAAKDSKKDSDSSASSKESSSTDSSSKESSSKESSKESSSAKGSSSRESSPAKGSSSRESSSSGASSGGKTAASA